MKKQNENTQEGKSWVSFSRNAVQRANKVPQWTKFFFKRSQNRKKGNRFGEDGRGEYDSCFWGLGLESDLVFTRCIIRRFRK